MTLIETRGEGGQAVIAPTPPGIHPERPERGYELVRGPWLNVPIIPPDERAALQTLSRSFNEHVDPASVHTPPETCRTRQRDRNRPGDRHASSIRQGFSCTILTTFAGSKRHMKALTENG